MYTLNNFTSGIIRTSAYWLVTFPVEEDGTFRMAAVVEPASAIEWRQDGDCQQCLVVGELAFYPHLGAGVVVSPFRFPSLLTGAPSLTRAAQFPLPDGGFCDSDGVRRDSHGNPTGETVGADLVRSAQALSAEQDLSLDTAFAKQCLTSPTPTCACAVCTLHT